MFNTISFERLLEVTAEDLAVIRENFGSVYMNETIDPEVKYVMLAEAFNKIDSWSSYFNKFKEIQDSKLDELSRENARLVGENKKLASENSKLKEDLVMLNEKMNKAHCRIGTLQATLEAKNGNSNMVQVDLVEMIESLEKAVNLIDENAKALSLSKKLKTEPRVNMHGEEHPKFKDNVKNEGLVADYKELLKYNEKHPEEQKAVLRELAEKYGLSIPGIRNRLITLGEYQARYNTNR